MCLLQIISGIVMSQLISELVQHDGRGKITKLLGIDIDEFDTDENTKGLAERKLTKLFLYFTLHVSHC
jgi:hypothetical protein